MLVIVDEFTRECLAIEGNRPGFAGGSGVS